MTTAGREGWYLNLRRPAVVVAVVTAAALVTWTAARIFRDSGAKTGQADARPRPSPRSSSAKPVVTRIPIGYAVSSLGVGAGAVWSSPGQSNILIRVDEATNEVRTFHFGGEIARPPVVGFGSVWIGLCSRPDPRIGNACRRMWILRLNPDTGKEVVRIRLPGLWPEPELAVGGGALWAGNWFHEATQILRIDPRSNRIVKKLHPPAGSGSGLRWGFGSLWLLASEPPRILRLNPVDGSTEATIPGFSCRVVMSEDSVWVDTSCYLNKPNELLRWDPEADEFVARVSLPQPVDDLVAVQGSIWLFRGDLADSTVHVFRLDPTTRLETDEIVIEPHRGRPVHEGGRLSYFLQASVSDGTLWVTYRTNAELVRIDLGD